MEAPHTHDQQVGQAVVNPDPDTSWSVPGQADFYVSPKAPASIITGSQTAQIKTSWPLQPGLTTQLSPGQGTREDLWVDQTEPNRMCPGITPKSHLASGKHIFLAGAEPISADFEAGGNLFPPIHHSHLTHSHCHSAWRDSIPSTSWHAALAGRLFPPSAPRCMQTQK